MRGAFPTINISDVNARAGSPALPTGDVDRLQEALKSLTKARDILNELVILGTYIVIAGAYLLLANKLDGASEKLNAITVRIEHIGARSPAGSAVQAPPPAREQPQK